MKKAGKIIHWIFAGIFTLFALVNGFHYSTLIMLAAAFLMTPVLRGKIWKNILLIILAVILLFTGILLSPIDNNDNADDTPSASVGSESEASSVKGESEVISSLPSVSSQEQVSSSDTSHTTESDSQTNSDDNSNIDQLSSKPTASSQKPTVSSEKEPTVSSSKPTSSSEEPSPEKPTSSVTSSSSSKPSNSQLVWITRTGKRYHSIPNCGSTKNASQATKKQAEARGLTPCSKCW